MLTILTRGCNPRTARVKGKQYESRKDRKQIKDILFLSRPQLLKKTQSVLCDTSPEAVGNHYTSK